MAERCLVTGAPEPYEICHVLPKTTPTLAASSYIYFPALFLLERAWDPRKCVDPVALAMPHNLGPGDDFRINLSTTRNLIYLTPDMHTLFDQNRWALVPTPGVLDTILDRWIERLPHGYHMYPDGQEYTFNFVPLNYKSTFLRFGPDNHPVTSHTHPFTDLPLTRSHIHPYFVICNTGEKVGLSDIAIEKLPISPGHRAALVKCGTLYKSWVGPNRNSINTGSRLPHGPSPSTAVPRPKPLNKLVGSAPNTTFESQEPGRGTHGQGCGENRPPTSDGCDRTKQCSIASSPSADSPLMRGESHRTEINDTISGDTADASCDYTTRIQDWVTATSYQRNLVDPNAHNGDPCLELYSQECSRGPVLGSCLGGRQAGH